MSVPGTAAGTRVVWHGIVGTVRYDGPVEGTRGSWLGVEWDDPSRGKHNGVHNGRRYFTPVAQGETCASFVRAGACCFGTSLLAVLRDLYPLPPEAPLDAEHAAQEQGLPLSEIRRARARAKARTLAVQRSVNLSSSLVDGQMDRLVRSVLDPARGEQVGDLKAAAPELTMLNLSHNLLASWDEVLNLLRETPKARDLNLFGNRLAPLERDGEGHLIAPLCALSGAAFSSKLASIELGGTGVCLSDALEVAGCYLPGLVHLGMGDTCPTPAQAKLALKPHPCIASLSLARNNCSNWDTIFDTLRAFPSLVQLDLSGNPLPPLPVALPAAQTHPHPLSHPNPDPASHSRSSMLVHDTQGVPLKSLILLDVRLTWDDMERLDRWVSDGGLFPSRTQSGQGHGNGAGNGTGTSTGTGPGIQSLQVTFPSTPGGQGQFGLLAPSDEEAEGMIRSASWSSLPALVGRAGLIARLPSLVLLNHTAVSPEERTAAELALLGAAQRIVPTLPVPEGEQREEAWASKLLGVPRLSELARKYNVNLEPARPPTEEKLTLAASQLTLSIVVLDQPLPGPDELVQAGEWAVGAASAQAQAQGKGEKEIKVLPSMAARMLRSKLVRALGLPRAAASKLEVAVSLGGLRRTSPLVPLPSDEQRPLADLGVTTGDTLLVFLRS